MELAGIQHRAGGEFELTGLREPYDRLFRAFDPAEFAKPAEHRTARAGLVVELGRAAANLAADLHEMVTFMGRLTSVMILAALQPHRIRWKETFRISETAGINAMPLTSLIGFLVGFIMAFQGAIPMRQFGAEIYVANLIALSMVRELGPLMTAIILAGRSGSAFAAEIGTMKVNEEIDALTTMGLDPVRYLAVPRVLAAVAMTPLLTVYANIISVASGSIVLISMGYPPIVYFNQVFGAIDYVDVWSGMVKSFVFGIMIAGVGCLRGLQTGTGPSAVGEATTSAVVSSIILITAADGVFAVIYYTLGI
jgi:phospholipid/cholesterol/gamma-HCH transport system permease protein